MDKSEKQQEGAQEKQQKSAIDRLNQGINTARDARSAYKISKRFANKLKGTKTTSKGFALAGRGGQLAVRIVTTLASTVEIWGPIALIVGFFVLVIIAVIVIFTEVAAPPTCKSLTASPTTISNSVPAVLTLENCSENITYSWNLPQIGGTFSAPQSATTSYTPPVVNTTQKVSIFVNVCSSSAPNNCSQYQAPELTIDKENISPCSRTDPAGCLKEEFNIVVGGNATEEKRSDIYRLLSEVAVATSYKTLLKTSGPTTVMFVNDSSKGGGCPARVEAIGGGRSKLTLYNYDLNGCYRTTRKSRLAHETGHIIRNGHMRLFQQFESQGYYPKDRSCYKIDNRFSPRYFIRTYDTSFGASLGLSISGSNETLAEFIALSVIPKDAYPRRCPVGYNWVKENIFDNYVFN